MATTQLNQASPSSPVPGTIRAAAAVGETVAESEGGVALAGLAELVRRPGASVWVDLTTPSIEQANDVGTALGLHPLIVEDVLEGNQRAKIETTDGVILATTAAIVLRRIDWISGADLALEGARDPGQHPGRLERRRENEVGRLAHLVGGAVRAGDADGQAVDRPRASGGPKDREGIGVAEVVAERDHRDRAQLPEQAAERLTLTAGRPRSQVDHQPATVVGQVVRRQLAIDGLDRRFDRRARGDPILGLADVERDGRALTLDEQPGSANPAPGNPIGEDRGRCPRTPRDLRRRPS